MIALKQYSLFIQFYENFPTFSFSFDVVAMMTPTITYMSLSMSVSLSMPMLMSVAVAMDLTVRNFFVSVWVDSFHEEVELRLQRPDALEQLVVVFEWNLVSNKIKTAFKSLLCAFKPGVDNSNFLAGQKKIWPCPRAKMICF